jgi:hypothetical protein
MFRSIAFGGGGMRGALHLGGLRALLEFQTTLQFPDGIYGYSIGSIIATALAFNLRLSQIQQMIDESMHLDSVVTHAKLSMFTDLVDKCGLLSMDRVEESIATAFLRQGVDLRGKVIADAPQKLCIGASNLTLRRPVFFTGQVPILTAIKASCCIPGFFQPQIVYNNVYVDGGVYMYYFDEYLPKECLSFTVSYTPRALRPQDLPGNFVELIKQLYCGQRRPPASKNAVWFKEDKVHVIHDIQNDDKKRLIQQGYSQVFAFLTKRLAEERQESCMGDSLSKLS